MTLTKSMFPGQGPYTFSSSDVGMIERELAYVLGEKFISAEHVGSSYVLGSGMDLDMVVHVRDMASSMNVLDLAGYACNSKDYADSTDNFKCFRNGLVNVMLVTDQKWYDNFLLSSEVCKAMNLCGLAIDMKAARIAVHRVIMDGEDAETAVNTAKAAVK